MPWSVWLFCFIPSDACINLLLFKSEASVSFTGDSVEDTWSMCLLSSNTPDKVPCLPSLLLVSPLTFCSHDLDMVWGLNFPRTGPQIHKQLRRNILPKHYTSKIIEETLYNNKILYTSLLKHDALTTCFWMEVNPLSAFVFVSMHVCLCVGLYTWAHVPAEGRKGYCIPWGWSYKWMRALHCGC